MGGKERILRCKEKGGKTDQSSLASFHAEVISMQLRNKRTRIQAKKERELEFGKKGIHDLRNNGYF